MTKPRRHEPLLPGDDGGHTGEIIVRIIPSGRRGFVRYTVASTGPVPMTVSQQIRALRAAADTLETGT